MLGARQGILTKGDTAREDLQGIRFILRRLNQLTFNDRIEIAFTHLI